VLKTLPGQADSVAVAPEIAVEKKLKQFLA
jgi:hypothetical protein